MKKIFYILPVLFLLVSACKKDNTDPVKTEIPGPDSGPFKKGPIQVQTMYPVNITPEDALYSGDEIFLLTTLQGIVAKSSSTQIYFYSRQDDYYYPPDNQNNDKTRTSSLLIKYLMTEEASQPISVVSNPSIEVWDIVDYFKDYIDGYVLCDASSDKWYRNLAVTLCGMTNSIPVNPADANTAENHGLKKKGNVNGYTSYMAFLTENSSQIDPYTSLELDPNKDGGPRDYAAMHSTMVFYAPGDAITRTNILSTINNSTTPIPVFGWDNKDADPNIQEYNFLNSVSIYGDFVVASDQSMNLSFLASSGTNPKQNPNPSYEPLTYDSTKLYVTFLMSDGDNMQLMTNNLNTKIWYGSPERGNFPIGWTMSPAMYYLEPDVWNYYLDQATENDEFILGPSTIGYVMGNVTSNSSKFAAQNNYLDEFLEKANIYSIMVFGDHVKPDIDWNNYDYLRGIMNCNDKLKGLFYKAYDDNGPRFPQMISNKPVAYIYLNIDPTQQSSNNIIEQGIGCAAMCMEAIDLGVFFSEPWAGNGFMPVYGTRNTTDGDFNKNNLMAGFVSCMQTIQEYNTNSGEEKIMVVLPTQFLDLMSQAYALHPERWEQH